MLSILRTQLCEGSKRKNEIREITSTDYVRIDNDATDYINNAQESLFRTVPRILSVWVESRRFLLHDSQAQDYTRHPKPPTCACFKCYVLFYVAH